MQKYISHFLLGLIAFTCMTCEEEKLASRFYPVLNTLPVTEINENGVTFNGEILKVEEEGGGDHGFVYGQEEGPTLNNSEKISLGDVTQTGNYSTLANRNLIKGKTYHVRAYAISHDDRYRVYGQTQTFVSLGGATPLISDFSPAEGVIGDTIVLKGSGFSNINIQNKVYFGSISAQVVKSTGDSVICVVPTLTPSGANQISLTVGQFTVNPKSKFTLKEFSIESVNTELVSFRDVITIHARNLPVRTDQIRITILGQNAKIIKHDGTELQAQVSDDVTLLEQPLIVTIGSQTKLSDKILKLKFPVISSFTPTQGKRESVVTISGENFHPVKNKQVVKFGDFTAEIVEATSSLLTVKIPSGLIDQVVDILINVSGQEVISTEKFHLVSPWRKIADMPGGPVSYATSWSDCGFGYVTLGIGDNTSSHEVWRYEPVTNTWSEASPFPGNSELFGQTSFAISCNGYVGGGGNNAGSSFTSIYRYSSQNDEWQSVPYFSLDESRYSSVGFTLNGKGYITLGSRGYLNVSQKETWEYDADLNSWTRMADFPGALNDNNNPTEFAIGGVGYIALGSTTGFWKYDASLDEWAKLPDFPRRFTASANSFAINSFGYVIGGSTVQLNGVPSILKEVWQYDTNQRVWTRLEDFPGKARHSAVTFTLAGKAYYGTGLGSDLFDDFWEFDPSKL